MLPPPRNNSPHLYRTPERSKCQAWFYEIRNSNNTLLKRDGGFATPDTAKIAARADAKKIKNSRQPGGPSVGTIMVGQDAGKPTR